MKMKIMTTMKPLFRIYLVISSEDEDEDEVNG